MEIKLIRVQRLDSIRLDESFFTPDGFFIDTPKVTRTGIFEYKNPDGSIRRELRLPEHVFDESSLATYEGKPVIITHNAGRVDKNNVADEIVGTMLSPGYKDGDSVRARVVIHDIDTVKRSGLRELSLGYDLVLDETPGKWQGKPYDAIQTQITINHLALVRDARAGDGVKLNLDSRNENMKGATKMGAKSKKPMSSQQLAAALEAKRGRRVDESELAIIKEIAELGTDSAAPMDTDTDKKHDAEGVKSSDAKIKAIKDKWDGRRKDTAPPKPDALPDLCTQQDSDIGTLLEIIECLQAKMDYDSTAADNADADSDKDDDGVMKADSADAIDAIVTERLTLARLGDKLNLDGLEKMKPLDAKKAVVKAVNPNMRLDGKGAVYVKAAFDQAVEQVNTRKDVNYQRQQMAGRMDGKSPHMSHDKTGAELARERMVEKLMNGGTDNATT